MTPKSLLRLPAATSTIDDLVNGGFQPLIRDTEIQDNDAVKRIVLCSGKLYYDLIEARKKSGNRQASVVRLEQFYPFPLQALEETLALYPNATQIVWAQEEPKNMGGWTFVEPRLEKLLPGCERAIYVGRAPSASPATGSYAIHQQEQASLVQHALTPSSSNEGAIV
jgi:2-oxoglutarate dehydrogenase E1 component